MRQLYLKDACPKLVSRISGELRKCGEGDLARDLENTVLFNQALWQKKHVRFDFGICPDKEVPYEERRFLAFTPDEKIVIEFESANIQVNLDCFGQMRWVYVFNMPEIYAAIQKSILNHDKSRAKSWSCKNLSLLYAKGEGAVKQDYAEAYFWFCVAAMDKEYKVDSDLIGDPRAHLSADQMASIRTRAETWMNSPNQDLSKENRGCYETGPEKAIVRIKGRNPGFSLQKACPDLVKDISNYFSNSGNEELVPQIEKTVVKSDSVGIYPNEFFIVAYPDPWWTWEERKARDIKEVKSIHVPIDKGQVRIDLDEVGRITWLYFYGLPQIYEQITKLIPAEPGYQSAGPELEAKLLDMLRAAGITDFETEHKNGAMTIKVKAASDEVGPLSVHVTANESILFCNVAHHHVNLMPPEQEEYEDLAEEIINRTARDVIDFVNDKIVFSESIKPDGGTNSRGWGKFRDSGGPISQADLDYVMKKEVGLKVTYWVFSRKLGTV
jgi:hypothetical protein